MKLIYAFLAAVAFADDHMGDDTDAAAADAEPEVIDSWTSTLVWEEGTGADWEKHKNWGKKFDSMDAKMLGLPTTLTAEPDADGVLSMTVMTEGYWPIEWKDENKDEYKDIKGCLDMGWVATVSEEDPEVTTSWEFTGVTVTRDSKSAKVSDLWNATGNLLEDSDIDWRKVGVDTIPNRDDSAAAITAWTGAGEIVIEDKKIKGVKMTATRPFVPTEERASAITLVNQVANYMCVSAWTTQEEYSGSAEAGCALFTINIPVPEPEPEPVVEPTETGASALYATALAFAAVAVMAF